MPGCCGGVGVVTVGCRRGVGVVCRCEGSDGVVVVVALESST